MSLTHIQFEGKSYPIIFSKGGVYPVGYFLTPEGVYHVAKLEAGGLGEPKLIAPYLKVKYEIVKKHISKQKFCRIGIVLEDQRKVLFQLSNNMLSNIDEFRKFLHIQHPVISKAEKDGVDNALLIMNYLRSCQPEGQIITSELFYFGE